MFKFLYQFAPHNHKEKCFTSHFFSNCNQIRLFNKYYYCIFNEHATINTRKYRFAFLSMQQIAVNYSKKAYIKINSPQTACH